MRATTTWAISLLFSRLIITSPVPDLPTTDLSWDVIWNVSGRYPVNQGSQVKPLEKPIPFDTFDVLLSWTFPKGPLPDNNKTPQMISTLRPWLGSADVITRMPYLQEPHQCTFPDQKCSDPAACQVIYQCLFKEFFTPSDQNLGFGSCVSQTLTATQYTAQGLNCPLQLYNAQKDLRQSYACTSDQYSLVPQKWLDYHVDDNLQTFLKGGIDTEGIWWPGADLSKQTLSKALGSQLQGSPDLECNIESPCTDQIDCNQIGSRAMIALGTTPTAVAKSQWGFYALFALEKISQQLFNQYGELKDALNRLALDTFTIGDFFPSPDQGFKLQNAITGMSTIFGIVGGFVPGGELLAAAGTIASAAGSFISSSVSSQSDPDIAQKNFATVIGGFYDDLVQRLDDGAVKIFNGETIGEGDVSFSLESMMKGGGWIGDQALTKVSDMSKLMHKELLCRSLNAMWKTAPSNKMWVNFLDLGDDAAGTKCQADTSGPQPLKYCAGGGVYYTYNFIQAATVNSDELGGVNFPWGAEEYLASKHDIDMRWITESSAKSYRLAKAHGLDPYNFPGPEGSSLFLSEAYDGPPGDTAITEMACRYPGSWTLPVCDMGTWGAAWNWNYADDKSMREQTYEFPPCLCGNGDGDMVDWANAAGLFDFKTFWHRCEEEMEKKNFQWPDGVTRVTLPGKINHILKKGGT
ncbi:uncharacterized protein KY384_001650 [Bacidia gigantensis]|uniref:uncharacterized protein n=1 Tax=Bacidia gigantensis TaxID=2732470 RepID=UPI001D05941A|nr:uncharacterized protein KY384_001650 [Bacidia gigantensis]KAG8533909.1 hypothetical protein KY384_001650 [Bacidia gigantensis]